MDSKEINKDIKQITYESRKNQNNSLKKETTTTYTAFKSQENPNLFLKKEDKEKIKEEIKMELRGKKQIKNIFMPTEAIEYIFSFLLIISILIGLFNFPIGSIGNVNSDEEIKFEVGYPFTFFEVSTNDSEGIPINFKGLLLDMLIFAIIAYLLNIVLNIIEKNVQNINKKDNDEFKREKYEEYILIYKKLKREGKSPKEINNDLKNKGLADEEITYIINQAKQDEIKEKNKAVNKEEIIKKAKEAYRILKKQNMPEEDIINKFLEKKWSLENIKKIKEEIENEEKTKKI